jgi:hypothetical protein
VRGRRHASQHVIRYGGQWVLLGEAYDPYCRRNRTWRLLAAAPTISGLSAAIQPRMGPVMRILQWMEWPQ